MKEYGEYKETNFPGLNQIPNHWTILRNKHILCERGELANDNSEQLLSLSQYTGITVKNKSNRRGIKASEDLSGYNRVEPGDIVMNIMLAWNGSTAISEYKGVISPAYAVYKTKKDINSKFLHFLFRLPIMTHYFKSFSTGIVDSRLRLYPDIFLSLFSIIPPRSEQDQIVRFLDYKLAKIDRLIAIKQRQIELLKDKILSLLHTIRETTKNYTSLKNITSLESNFINIETDKEYQKLGMYNRGRGIFFREKTPGSELGQSSFQQIAPNRLIFSGQFAWEGAVSITREIPAGAVASHRYHLLYPNPDMAVAEYLWSFFISEEGNTILNSCSHGAAGRNKPLNIRELLEAAVPLPEKEKQHSIKRQVLGFEKFRNITAESIQLLQEYRARLISDAVTGAIDVRDYKIPEGEPCQAT